MFKWNHPCIILPRLFAAFKITDTSIISARINNKNSYSPICFPTENGMTSWMLYWKYFAHFIIWQGAFIIFLLVFFLVCRLLKIILLYHIWSGISIEWQMIVGINLRLMVFSIYNWLLCFLGLAALWRWKQTLLLNIYKEHLTKAVVSREQILS